MALPPYPDRTDRALSEARAPNQRRQPRPRTSGVRGARAARRGSGTSSPDALDVVRDLPAHVASIALDPVVAVLACDPQHRPKHGRIGHVVDLALPPWRAVVGSSGSSRARSSVTGSWWYWTRFQRVARDAGVPVIPLHGARHTYAELALSAGVRLDVVSRQLGRASIATTANVYSHGSDEAAAEAAEACRADPRLGDGEILGKRESRRADHLPGLFCACGGS